MRTRHWVCGCFALGLSAGVFSAPAAGDWVSQEMKVSYADLDLTKPEGAAALYRRIETAARAVCSPASNGDYLRMRPYFRTCYRNAVDKAVADVNRPSVVALHRDNGNKSRVPRG